MEEPTRHPAGGDPAEGDRPAEEAGSALARREDTGVLVGRIVGGSFPGGSEEGARAPGAGERGRLLADLAAALADSGRAARRRGVAGGRWITELFTEEIGPRIPVRDRATLVRHHGGLEGEELADALVRNAVRATTGVGAAGGALAAVQMAAPPLLLTAPAKLVAETLVVAAVEVKLIGELHEVYGAAPGSGLLRRNTGYLASWAHKRGVDPTSPEDALLVVAGVAAKTALRRRLLRLLGRHLTTFGPYLTGALAGGALNRAATTALARTIRADLRATSLTLGGEQRSRISGAGT